MGLHSGGLSVDELGASIEEANMDDTFRRVGTEGNGCRGSWKELVSPVDNIYREKELMLLISRLTVDPELRKQMDPILDKISNLMLDEESDAAGTPSSASATEAQPQGEPIPSSQSPKNEKASGATIPAGESPRATLKWSPKIAPVAEPRARETASLERAASTFDEVTQIYSAQGRIPQERFGVLLELLGLSKEASRVALESAQHERLLGGLTIGREQFLDWYGDFTGARPSARSSSRDGSSGKPVVDTSFSSSEEAKRIFEFGGGRSSNSTASQTTMRLGRRSSARRNRKAPAGRASAVNASEASEIGPRPAPSGSAASGASSTGFTPAPGSPDLPYQFHVGETAQNLFSSTIPASFSFGEKSRTEETLPGLAGRTPATLFGGTHRETKTIFSVGPEDEMAATASLNEVGTSSTSWNTPKSAIDLTDMDIDASFAAGSASIKGHHQRKRGERLRRRGQGVYSYHRKAHYAPEGAQSDGSRRHTGDSQHKRKASPRDTMDNDVEFLFEIGGGGGPRKESPMTLADNILKTWEKQKEQEGIVKEVLAQMESALEEAQTLRAAAKGHYIQRRYVQAAEQYGEAIDTLKAAVESEVGGRVPAGTCSDAFSLLGTLHWNRAAVWLMLGMHSAASEECTKAMSSCTEQDRAKLVLRCVKARVRGWNVEDLEAFLRQIKPETQATNDEVEQSFRVSRDVEFVRSELSRASQDKNRSLFEECLTTVETCLKISPVCRDALQLKCDSLMALQRHSDLTSFIEGAAKILSLSSCSLADALKVARRAAESDYQVSALGVTKFFGASMLETYCKSLKYTGREGEAEKLLRHCNGEGNKWAGKLLQKWKTLQRAKETADMSYSRGAYSKAVEGYGAALKLDPDDADFSARLLCNRAAALMGLRLYSRAAVDCTAALAKKPDYHRARLRRARARRAAGLWSSSLDDYTAWLGACGHTKEANEVRREAEVVRRRQDHEREAEYQRQQAFYDRVDSPWGKSGDYFANNFGGYSGDEQDEEDESEDDYDFYRRYNFYAFGGSGSKRASSGPNRTGGRKYSSSGVASSSAEKNHYTTLGVARGATQDDIKKAFRKLALQWHPDKNSSPEAADKFRDINAAYKVVGDVGLRREYDRRLW